MARIPNQQRVDPVGRAPITDSSGVATDFFARQWKNLVDLVTSVITLQDDSVANAARITALEGTEIGGTAGQITPLPAPLSAGNITLELANTAVTPGTYGDALTSPQITVDQKGRITGVVGIPITGGGGGGGGGCWELVTTLTIAAGTTTEDITGLADYDDLLVILEGSTSSSSQARGMRVSTDNGATFLTTSGDYQSIQGSSAQANTTIMGVGTATTGARTCWWWLTNKNSTDNPKIVRTNDALSYLIRTALPIDAVQLRNGIVGTLSSGTVYVFGLICGGGGGGGGDVAVEDDGVSIVAAASTLNFTGAGVVVTDAGGGQVDIDIEPVELFLGPSDETDDSGAVYFYFGWASVNGSWLVRRQTRATSLTQNANIVNNASYANLTAAWPARASLTYS